ncbi:hypothetical protein ACFVJM_32440 [Streptomyces virginiae]|uniref:hypothetical protein n=1 Tax=Streptomyces virginiae TaxID=1961 RepID=UPI0036408B81
MSWPASATASSTAHQVLAQPGGLHAEPVAFLPQGCRLCGQVLQQDADGLDPDLLRAQALTEARFPLLFGSCPFEPGVEGGAVASAGVLFRFGQGVQAGGLALVVLSLRAERVLGYGEGLARRLVPGQEVVVGGLLPAALAEGVLQHGG